MSSTDGDGSPTRAIISRAPIFTSHAASKHWHSAGQRSVIPPSKKTFRSVNDLASAHAPRCAKNSQPGRVLVGLRNNILATLKIFAFLQTASLGCRPVVEQPVRELAVAAAGDDLALRRAMRSAADIASIRNASPNPADWARCCRLPHPGRPRQSQETELSRAVFVDNFAQVLGRKLTAPVCRRSLASRARC
jgi:hypothetical protein